jgi:hypothetical protein
MPRSVPFGNHRHDPSRTIRAPRGAQLTCKSWLSEAAYRMIQNNLDPEVAERPEDLVVYGGIGRAARDWACYDAILEFPPIRMRRACCWRIPISYRIGRPGSTSTHWIGKA